MRPMSRSLVRLLLAHAAAFAAVGFMAACGGGSSDDSTQASCPKVGSVTCPTPQPSFKTDIQPLIEKRCYPCHGPGGIEVSQHNFTNYNDISADIGDIATQIGTCMMPEPDAAPLTAEELTEFLQWIECNSPNN